MKGGGRGGPTMQGGQETREEVRVQDGHDVEPGVGQINQGGQDGGEEACGEGLIG